MTDKPTNYDPQEVAELAELFSEVVSQTYDVFDRRAERHNRRFAALPVLWSNSRRRATRPRSRAEAAAATSYSPDMTCDLIGQWAELERIRRETAALTEEADNLRVLVQHARHEARKIYDRALDQAADIIAKANEEAKRILEAAHQEADQARLEATQALLDAERAHLQADMARLPAERRTHMRGARRYLFGLFLRPKARAGEDNLAQPTMGSAQCELVRTPPLPCLSASRLAEAAGAMANQYQTAEQDFLAKRALARSGSAAVVAPVQVTHSPRPAWDTTLSGELRAIIEENRERVLADVLRNRTGEIVPLPIRPPSPPGSTTADASRVPA